MAGPPPPKKQGANPRVPPWGASPHPNRAHDSPPGRPMKSSVSVSVSAGVSVSTSVSEGVRVSVSAHTRAQLSGRLRRFWGCSATCCHRCPSPGTPLAPCAKGTRRGEAWALPLPQPLSPEQICLLGLGYIKKPEKGRGGKTGVGLEGWSQEQPPPSVTPKDAADAGSDFLLDSPCA